MIEVNPLTVAQVIATQAHAGQTYGVLPYTHHLDHVEQVLRRYFDEGLDDHGATYLYVAAWLHDALEDTDLEAKVIREIFGDYIADLVEAVTDEPGPNRKTRKALTYPKIKRAGADAIILKLADRIANVEMSRSKGSLIKMYQNEHDDFKSIANIDTEVQQQMWDDLEKLLFP
jgi:(p)ppGpp synthase/HD superfamily hydrolase